MKRLKCPKKENVKLHTLLRINVVEHESQIDKVLLEIGKFNKCFVVKLKNKEYLGIYKDGHELFTIQFKSINEIKNILNIPFVKYEEDFAKIKSENLPLCTNEKRINSQLLGIRSTLGSLINKKIKLEKK
jgi:hypothetical protein